MYRSSNRMILELQCVRRVAVATFVFVLLTNLSFGQRPRVQMFSVFPMGGRQGTEVEVQITSGGDLESVNRLLFSHPGIRCLPSKEGGDRNQCNRGENNFLVSVSKEVPPGRYEVRAFGRFGVSNARSFVVSDAKEVLEKEPNNQPEEAQAAQLESVINGRCQGAQDRDLFSFELKKGQRVFWECRAARADSRLDSSLVVFDAHGKELTNNRDHFGADAFIDFTAPEDGRYVVQLRDFLFREGSEYGYRLFSSSRPRIDFVYPPIGQPGQKQAFTVYGRNLPGARPLASDTGGTSAWQVKTVDVRLAASDDNQAGRFVPLEQVDANVFDFTFPGAPPSRSRLAEQPHRSSWTTSRTTRPKRLKRLSCHVNLWGNLDASETVIGLSLMPSRETYSGSKSIHSGLTCERDPFVVLHQVQYDEQGQRESKTIGAAR